MSHPYGTSYRALKQTRARRRASQVGEIDWDTARRQDMQGAWGVSGEDEVSSGMKPEGGVWQWCDAGNKAVESQDMRGLKSSTKYFGLSRISQKMHT